MVYPIEGSSAYGSVTQNFLTLSLTRTQCGDAGVYMCEAAYLNTNIVTFTANSTLSVEGRSDVWFAHVHTAVICLPTLA